MSAVGCDVTALFFTLSILHMMTQSFECNTFISYLQTVLDVLWGHAVAQLVEALRYKPEGRGFDSRWCHWNFSLT